MTMTTRRTTFKFLRERQHTSKTKKSFFFAVILNGEENKPEQEVVLEIDKWTNGQLDNWTIGLMDK